MKNLITKTVTNVQKFSMVKRVSEFFFYTKETPLGRWKWDGSHSKASYLKVDQGNYDHCGTCLYTKQRPEK